MFLFMILWSLLFAGKQALSNVKNFLPMLVATFLLNGGLNQVIFLLLFLLLFSFVLFVRGSDFFGSLSLGVSPLLFWMVPLLVYFSSSLCPLFFSTLL